MTAMIFPCPFAFAMLAARRRSVERQRAAAPSPSRAAGGETVRDGVISVPLGNSISDLFAFIGGH